MAGKVTDLIRQGIRTLQKFEDGILISLLLLMISVAVFQIVARNIFDSGIRFGDELIRVLVLWISLMGAMVASRNNSHVNIDLISRYLPRQIQKMSMVLVGFFTSFICAVMSWFSYDFVMMEKLGGVIAFAGIPIWVCQSIIPVSFGIISFRYLLLSFTTLFDSFKQNI
ncbi:MAG: TRAP transporter small permease [Desulfobacula sp.]|jgi:TRAP-type C4-dicarboxylate transport system permease small subunit